MMIIPGSMNLLNAPLIDPFDPVESQIGNDIRSILSLKAEDA